MAALMVSIVNETDDAAAAAETATETAAAAVTAANEYVEFLCKDAFGACRRRGNENSSATINVKLIKNLYNRRGRSVTICAYDVSIELGREYKAIRVLLKLVIITKR